ncbi:hypothetical protein [Nonomuraea sp. NEAU-A123]|uniref:hypothetical protein n=1 Tax=Nonomuraea sp. NEAU-A123 TaxID=2839649 RepID=UPI001BE4092A|nr:hypothetical protein [Nonomuraea sp. NEAU-A123]MBT2228557.1 hypothetical protein [Nonomuraea sp. NEAU-A123]
MKKIVAVILAAITLAAGADPAAASPGGSPAFQTAYTNLLRGIRAECPNAAHVKIANRLTPIVAPKIGVL